MMRNGGYDVERGLCCKTGVMLRNRGSLSILYHTAQMRVVTFRLSQDMFILRTVTTDSHTVASSK